MPEHGEIVVVEVPATKRRRRWCEPCYEWTWEVGRLGSGQFRHSRRGSLGIERPCKSLEANDQQAVCPQDHGAGCYFSSNNTDCQCPSDAPHKQKGRQPEPCTTLDGEA